MDNNNGFFLRVHDICVRVCTGEGEEEQAGAVKDTRSESECTRDTRPTRSYEQYRTPIAERYDSTHTHKKKAYTLECSCTHFMTA